MNFINAIKKALDEKKEQSVGGHFNALFPQLKQPNVVKDIISGGGIKSLERILQTKRVFLYVPIVTIFGELSSHPEAALPLSKDAVPTILMLTKTEKNPQFIIRVLMMCINLSVTKNVEVIVSLIENGVLELISEVYEDDDFLESPEDLEKDILIYASTLLAAICFGANADPDDPIVVDVGEKGVPNKAVTLFKNLIQFEKKGNQVDDMVYVYLIRAFQFLSRNEKIAIHLHKQGLNKLLDAISSKSNKNLVKQADTLLQVLSYHEELVEDLTASAVESTDSTDKDTGEQQKDQIDILIDQARDGSNVQKQYQALGHIYNYCQKPSNRTVFRNKGIISVIMQILEESEYSQVLERTIMCLVELLADQECSFLFSLKKGVKLLGSLLSVDSFSDLPLLIPTLTCLAILSARVLVREEMTSIGLIERFSSIIKLLLSQLDHKRKDKYEDELFFTGISYTMKMLTALACEEKGRIQLLNSGIVDILIEIAKGVYDLSEQTRIDASAALWNLNESPLVEPRINELNGLEYMTAYLDKIDLAKYDPLARQAEMFDEETVRKEAEIASKNFDRETFDVQHKNLRKMFDDLEDDDDDDDKAENEEGIVVVEPADDDDDDNEKTAIVGEEEDDDDDEAIAIQPAEDDDDDDDDDDKEEEAVEVQPAEDDDDNDQKKESQGDEEEEEGVIIAKPAEDDDDEVVKRDPKRRFSTRRRTIKSTVIVQQQNLLRDESKLSQKPIGTNEKEKKKERKEKLKQQKEEEKRLKERATKRKHIANELLKTEESYVDALEKVKKMFIEPLRTTHKDVLTEEEFKTIFSSIGSIHAINFSFLQELRKLYAKSDLLENVERYLGFLFIVRAKTFKPYTRYVNIYDDVEECVHQCTKKNKAFKEFMDEVSEKLSNLGYRQNDLNSFLIMPVCISIFFISFLIASLTFFLSQIQRLPRYSLLLSDLLKYSDLPPRVTARSYLENAITQVTKITTFVNENKRDFENRQKVFEIQKKLGLKNLASNEDRILKKIVKDIQYHVYEKNAKPYGMGTKGKLYICNDLLILSNSGLKIQRKTYQIPISDCITKKFLGDSEEKTFIIQDNSPNATAVLSKKTTETSVMYSVRCPDKQICDEVYTMILNL